MKVFWIKKNVPTQKKRLRIDIFHEENDSEDERVFATTTKKAPEIKIFRETVTPKA